jgi:hypothetical protein
LSPFWRREKPLHERLAEEGGLLVPSEGARDLAPWHQAGIHGVPRPREYDAVVSLEVAGGKADEIAFVELEDRTLLLESEEDVDLEPFANALEGSISPPYRAFAVRKSGSTWAVAANVIDIATIEEPVDGETIELAVQSDERTMLVDGAAATGSLPALERLAEGFDDYVIRATRLDGDLWEVKVVPL